MLKAFTTTIALGLLVGGSALAQTTPSPAPTPGAMKMSEVECTSLWNRLDASKSGSLAEAQVKPHISDFKAVDTNNDGKLSQAEFKAGCDKGLVRSTAATGPGNDTQKK